MSDNSLQPSDNNKIQVVGMGVTMGAYMIRNLLQYSADIFTSGYEGMVIAWEGTQFRIRRLKLRIQELDLAAEEDFIVAVRITTALKISRGMDLIENHPEIRPSIKQKTLAEMEIDFDELSQQIRRMINNKRFIGGA